MPQWIQVIRAGELKPGRMRDFELLDGTMLGVANAGGTFHAFDATCPHKRGPLVSGRLEAGELTCPWHGYRYALATGENLAPGVGTRVRLFPARVRDGYVEVESPEQPGGGGAMLRKSLLTLATRPAVQRWATASPIARRLAGRFVAGETAEEALTIAAALNKQGLTVTLDQLGEHVATPDEAAEAADEYCRLVDQIAARGLAANISIKPTHLGLALAGGPDLAAANLRRLLERARPYNLFVRVDMEGSAVTQATLDLLWRLRGEGFGEVGPVIQAYLYRSAEDIARLCAEGVRVRLCKGAYQEPATIAFPRKADVDASYERLMEYLLRRGHYPGLATHDERLITHARALAAREAILPERFEFQLLYGVRRGLQSDLARAGYNVRVYVPYGERWYPYFMRRLAERPANLLFLLRNLWRS